jgi:hypothetical protein
MFLNHYECPRCRTAWSDECCTTSDDDCPKCSMNCSPHQSEDKPLPRPTGSDPLSVLLRAAMDLLEAKDNQMETRAEWDALRRAVEYPFN